MTTLTSSALDWHELATQLYLHLNRLPPPMHPSFKARAEDYTLEIAVLEKEFRRVGNPDTVKAAIRECLSGGELANDFTALYRRLGCK